MQIVTINKGELAMNEHYLYHYYEADRGALPNAFLSSRQLDIFPLLFHKAWVMHRAS
ncbi:hypothetical protein GCM10023310_45430 [Paenibacillus vulneris]